MAKRATLYDVAERAGVSTATVSFAFTQPHRVRAATLERVLEAARTLGYMPSGTARGLARGVTGAIGLYSYDYLIDAAAVVAPARTAYRTFPLYVDEVQYGVEMECRRLGYALLVSGARTHPSTPAVVDLAGRVDGLIVFAGSLTAEEIGAVARRIPVVALGSDVNGSRVGTVRVDDGLGMRQVVEHLLAAHGCRRLLFLGEGQTVEMQSRYQAFAEVLGDAGLVAAEPLPSRPGVDETTVRVVRSCLERGELPDAFVCATDQEALVTLDTLASAGRSVPRDVLVTGFDGIVAGRLSRPTLTTVQQPMAEIGRTAVRTLVSLMGEGERDQAMCLGVELLLGGSCGCPDPAQVDGGEATAKPQEPGSSEI